MSPLFLSRSEISLLIMRAFNLIKGVALELVVFTVLAVPLAMGQASPTTTTLTVSSSSVSSGTTVTLTASVSNGAPITVGQVSFCDANAKYCEDSALVGTAQLTSSGTATIKTIPAIGNHDYKAVFNGTNTNASSTSAVQSLTVSGSTTTTISVSGSPGNYTLTGTVVAQGATLPPTGSVSFVDTTDNYVVGSASLGSAVLDQRFAAKDAYQASSGALYVQAGDFNGDGTADLAIAWEETSVCILLSNGDGSFQPCVLYPVGNRPQTPAVGDFNGDGFLDVAVSNLYDNTVSVLLGNGDGTFKPQVAYDTGCIGYKLVGASQPSSIATGDFNGDGITDLAVAMAGGDGVGYGGVTVLLGLGNGTFQPSWRCNTYAIPRTALSVSAGDFNGDGKVDLVVTGGGGGIWTLQGNGDGSFSVSPNIYYVGIDSLVRVGDINGDGAADLVGANSSNGKIEVLLGNGDGTFANNSEYNAGNGARGVSIGDFNGDSVLDVGVLNYYDNTVSMLFGNPDGSFNSQLYSAGYSPFSATVGDFNRDGILDLAILNTAFDDIDIFSTVLTETITAVQPSIFVPGTGSHEIHAVYSGDDKFKSSTSSTISLTASPVSTTLVLTANPSSSTTYGQQVILSATLTPSSQGTLTSDGETLNFQDGAKVIGTGVLRGGAATILVSTLSTGAHNLMAVYAGDLIFLPSTSSGLPFIVSKADAPTITLTPSSTALFVGSTVTFTAELPSSALVPTGIVGFYDGSTLLGTSTLAHGLASYSTSTLALGVHSITAVYGGDGNFTNATSSVVQEKIQDFSIKVKAGTPSSVTLVGGGTANYQLVITPSNGTTFPASLALSVSGLPPSASHTFVPPVVSSGAGSTAVTLTIQVPHEVSSNRNATTFLLACSLATGLLLLGNTSRHRNGPVSNRTACLLFALTISGVATMSSACGSSSSPPNQSASHPTVYTVSVAATSGTLSHSTVVTLTLQ